MFLGTGGRGGGFGGGFGGCGGGRGQGGRAGRGWFACLTIFDLVLTMLARVGDRG